MGAAVTGDLLIGVARNRGAAGFVTDGLVRDLDDLETVGLPVFAMGVTPNSPQQARSRLGRAADRVRRRNGRLRRRGGGRSRRRGRRSARPHIRDARNLEQVKAVEAATLERVRGGLKELPVEVPALRRIGGA